MPPKKIKPVAPKDVAIYLVEADENDVVPEDSIQLVRHCVMDKIFSDNQDHIAICRADESANVQFDPADWNALRKVEKKFREPGKPRTDPISALIDMCKVINAQGECDSYECKKILFFALLKVDLKEKKLKELATVLEKSNINVSIILPDEKDMDATQLENNKSLKSIMDREEHEDFIYICSRAVAKKQILNTLSKPAKRSMPWNVSLEIGPDIEIAVSGYVCTRKNTQNELKKALVTKDATSSSAWSQNVSTQVAIPSSMEGDGDFGHTKTVVVEFASKITDREYLWKGKDGTVVDDEDVGKGYFYGDRLIPFNELENEDAYKSGDKCLKVIVFCPKDKILPAFHQGDGTTLFYAKKGDSNAEVKLSALLQVLHKNDRVAIVRKVYRKNCRVNLGVLSADVDRKCLVYSEICYADDISVPHFPALFKQDSISEEDGNTLSEKEQLIDSLILGQTLDGFHPFEGPIDPAAASLRNNISSRILDPKATTTSCADVNDNIDIFFRKVILEEQLEQLQSFFPLKMIKQTDRPAGANIFRKRPLDAITDVDQNEKKIKTEEDMEVENEIVPVAENNDLDYDDLLDNV